MTRPNHPDRLAVTRTGALVLAAYLPGGPFAPDRLGPSHDRHAAPPQAQRPPHIPPDLWARASWHARARWLRRHPQPPDPPWRLAAIRNARHLPERGHVLHLDPTTWRNPR